MLPRLVFGQFAIVFLLPVFATASPVIDDGLLRSKFLKKLEDVVKRDDHVKGKDLAKQMPGARKKKSIELSRPESDGEMSYDDEVNGVVMLGAVYKCDKCDKWHFRTAATAWVLSNDGLMVTNDHVFASADSEAYGVMSHDGKFAEVMKVEIADKVSDIAIFRVKGDGFKPLPLAKMVSVGESVHVISHPQGRHFTYTAGRISRLHKRPGKGRSSTWMSITADYAQGSSGGPVLNDRGEIVGMVSSTQSLYYRGKAPAPPKDRGHLQMVIKNCVSLEELKRLVSPATDVRAKE